MMRISTTRVVRKSWAKNGLPALAKSRWPCIAPRMNTSMRGITLADTKFEFGLVAGSDGHEELILVDEALMPDSSRFWVKGSFEQGAEPISFDKQYVRDYLESLGWNKQPPPPALPAEVIANTARRYAEIFKQITGKMRTDRAYRGF